MQITRTVGDIEYKKTRKMQRKWQGYQDKQDVYNYFYPDHPVIPASVSLFFFT
jgi:hypothetical protein